MALRTLDFASEDVAIRISRFPGSRYMGSKHAILPFLESVLSGIEFDTALDAFAGSTAVSYLLKAMGKGVHANDFLALSYHTAKAIIENSGTILDSDDIRAVAECPPTTDGFVSQTFRDLYFADDENAFLDGALLVAEQLSNEAKRSLVLAALVRACLKRRPRGLFTYTGVRYLDGRKDEKMSLREHFASAAAKLSEAVFAGDRPSRAYHSDVFELKVPQVDLVYLDPPYVSTHSDNDYTRRYHFIEGLVRNWEGLEIEHHTATRKFKRIPSAFDSRRTIVSAFDDLFARWRDSIIVVSYSSNGIPTCEEMLGLLKRHKRRVRVHEHNHRYSFGTHGQRVGSNRNQVVEYLFVGE